MVSQTKHFARVTHLVSHHVLREAMTCSRVGESHEGTAEKAHPAAPLTRSGRERCDRRLYAGTQGQVFLIRLCRLREMMIPDWKSGSRSRKGAGGRKEVQGGDSQGC